MVEYTGGAELTPCFSRSQSNGFCPADPSDTMSGDIGAWAKADTFDWESRWQNNEEWDSEADDWIDDESVLPDEMDSVGC
jgi:hypothetical protein